MTFFHYCNGTCGEANCLTCADETSPIQATDPRMSCENCGHKARIHRGLLNSKCAGLTPDLKLCTCLKMIFLPENDTEAKEVTPWKKQNETILS